MVSWMEPPVAQVVILRFEGGDVSAHEKWAVDLEAASMGLEEGGGATVVAFDGARVSAEAARAAVEARADAAAFKFTVSWLRPLGGRSSWATAVPVALSSPVASAAGRSFEGFKPLAKALTARSLAPDGKADAVIVVDPISTGARLAALAKDRGFAIIRLMSQSMPPEVMSMMPSGLEGLDWLATVEHTGDYAETVAKLRAIKAHVFGFLIGCESGVEFNDDFLSKHFTGFPTNAPNQALARRDKFPMGEAIRDAGLRAAKQKLCRSWATDGRAFCADLLGAAAAKTSPPPAPMGGGGGGGGFAPLPSRWCVLKPCKSAGTDGVYIAKSLAEAEQRFGEILGHDNVFGEVNNAVLCQEFLAGTEFVVDSVSVEGVHKVVAIWVYDKRPANGAQFVYYGMRLFQSEDGKREAALAAYVFKVLDALGVRHGPSHAEVMWLHRDDEPCLVEVGCRPHGGEGTFIDMVDPIIGYNQCGIMLDAIEKPYRFHRLPSRPAKFSGAAVEICLVCYEDGLFLGWVDAGLEAIRGLPSFIRWELKVKPGSPIEPTTDFLNTPGSIMLTHKDKAQLDADSEVIRGLERAGLFSIAAPLSPARKFRPENL